MILSALYTSGLQARRLELEITESVLLEESAQSNSLLREFQKIGLKLSIDDFGTGYSSLMQLRQLPFTELKVDQAFVADLARSRDCRMIVQAITELAHRLGLTVTAEGVETIEQLHLIHEIGCDLAQGYFISPPLEPQALGSWKRAFRRNWPKMIAEEPLALWSDVEADALGER
jgi:EAL domain-containing protein (putative c-di-GMP-specific phosphodiesterase class I)